MNLQLAPFVPELILQHLTSCPEHRLIKAPQRQDIETVVLFADVSGFTKLSETLALKGPVGAEELGFYLNRYIERLVKVIAKSGGDIFKFAGDAIVVLWPPSTDAVTSKKDDLQLMVRRAAQCSLDVQDELQNAELAEDVKFSVKLGIGVGKVTILHVGGLFNRLEYLACGSSLTQAFRAEGLAVAGEIVLSEQAWSLIRDFFDQEYPASEPGFFHLNKTMKAQRVRNKSIKRRLNGTAGVENKLRQYVPAAVIPYLSMKDSLWGSELRRITIVFVSLGFEASELQEITQQTLARVQEVVSIVQSAVYMYEGSFNKFLVDDKGSTLIAVFGLPPLAHTNDPSRALLSAVSMRQRLQAIGLGCAIGVTSGLSFCGLVGSGSRREYSILGDVVNLAARLMTAASGSKYGILCDRTTRLSARKEYRLRFERLPEMLVKGKSEPVKVYCPLAQQVELTQPQPKPHLQIPIGRSHLIKEINHRVLARVGSLTIPENKTPNLGAILLVGEIGVGTTAVLEYVNHFLRSSASVGSLPSELKTVWGKGDPLAPSEPLFTWSTILRALIEMSSDQQLVSPRGKQQQSNKSEEVCPNTSDGNRKFFPGQKRASIQKVHTADSSVEYSHRSSLRTTWDFERAENHRTFEDTLCNMLDRHLGPGTSNQAYLLNNLLGVKFPIPDSSSLGVDTSTDVLSCVDETTTDAIDISKPIKSTSAEDDSGVNKSVASQSNIVFRRLSRDFNYSDMARRLSMKEKGGVDLSYEHGATLLLRLLRYLGPAVIIIDDARFMGADDWRFTLLAIQALHAVSGFSIIISCCPMENPKYAPRFKRCPPEYIRIRFGEYAHVINVNPLSIDGVEEYLKIRWSCSSVESELLNIVYERTGGNPTFCAKLADMMFSTGMVVQDNEQNSLRLVTEYSTQNGKNWLAGLLPVPYYIQRVAASHIDHLSPSQLLLLKVAAVLCMAQKGYKEAEFNFGMVRSIHPVADKTLLEDDLVYLEKELHVIKKATEPKLDSTDNSQKDEIAQRRSRDLATLEEMWFPRLKSHNDTRRNEYYLDNEIDTQNPTDRQHYIFIVGFFRDALYELMLHVQRRRLHKRAVKYFTTVLTHNGTPVRSNILLQRHKYLAARHSKKCNIPSNTPKDVFPEKKEVSVAIPHRLSTVLVRTTIDKTGALPEHLSKCIQRATLNTSLVASVSSKRSKTTEISNAFALPSSSINPKSTSSKLGCFAAFKSFFHNSSIRNQAQSESDSLPSDEATSDDMTALNRAPIYQPSICCPFGRRRNTFAPHPRMRRFNSLDSIRQTHSVFMDADVQGGAHKFRNSESNTSIHPLRGSQSESQDIVDLSVNASNIQRRDVTLAIRRRHSIGILQRLLKRNTLEKAQTRELELTLRMLSLCDRPASIKPMNKYFMEDEPAVIAAVTHGLEVDYVRCQHTLSRSSQSLTLVDNSSLTSVLSNIDKWSFNIIALEEVSRCNPLSYVSFALFYKFGLFEKFNIDKHIFLNFLTEIEAGYQVENPYHNSAHAADVTQSVNFFLTVLDMPSYITQEDLLSIILAAIVHDFRHPGLTHQFLVDASHQLATTYNDMYVLENFHCAATFEILNKQKCDIFASFPPRKVRRIRSRMIQLILSTNLTDHFSIIDRFKATVVNTAGQVTEENRDVIMQMVLKCADICNPAKPFPLYSEWTGRIVEEFYLQGDVERYVGMAVSRFMDRENPDFEVEVAECQLTFINCIVKPAYMALAEFSPAVRSHCMPYIEQNISIWEKYKEDGIASMTAGSSYLSSPRSRTDYDDLPMRCFFNIKAPTTFNMHSVLHLNEQADIDAERSSQLWGT